MTIEAKRCAICSIIADSPLIICKMEEDDIISLSTRFRFQKTKRQDCLHSFLSFKRQYENYFNPQRIRQIKKVYHHGICGRNQHRHIVVVDRIGSIKVQDLNKVFLQGELVCYFNQRMLELSERHLSEKDQVIWIVDLSGKIMQLASKKMIDTLHKIIDNLQNYFPDILYRLVFVNTPMLFDTIWNSISPSIPPATQEKILMIGNELENIYEFAEPKMLPEFLGGEVDDQMFASGQFTQKVEKKEEEEEEEEFDFSQLKQALGGMKFGGKALQSVSQTPLNTEADK